MTDAVRRSSVKSQRLLARTRRLAAWMRDNGDTLGDIEKPLDVDDDALPANGEETAADPGNPLD